MRAVIYARYSGDRQRETSIDDQARNCTRYAEREGLTVQKVYQDKAVSGSTNARHEYQAMLRDAAAQNFDVLIVDDLSRLSRDEYEMKGLLRRLVWQSIRVVGVSDGYDSSQKGHKIHAGFKGLMNEIFLDDLRDRTHRGMSGQAMKGYNCGGRTYGYRNVPIEDPVRRDAYGRAAIAAVRYEIHEEQAAIVRQMFSWYADGHSYAWIASELNRQRVPASRGGSWAQSAIKVILENQMYEGKLIWNRRQWVKHPDTGNRLYRRRPKEEWIVTEQPELRIVDDEVARAVRRRQQVNKVCYASSGSLSSARRYLFSGLMTCAECGGNMVLVAHNRYGCARRKTRGEAACRNGITVSRHIVEERLLHHLKHELGDPKGSERFARITANLLKSHNAKASDDQLQRQLHAAERARDNILQAIKSGIITPTTKEALEAAEADIAGARRELERLSRSSVSAMLPRAVERYKQLVANLEQNLGQHVNPARQILKSLLGESIRIHRKGEHLEAELPSGAVAWMANCLKSEVDLVGCGGPQRGESTFISLAPEPSDSTPLKHRNRG